MSNFARTPKQTNSVGLYLYFAGALVADSNSFFLSDPNANCVWRISRQDGSAEIYAGVPPDWMISGPKAGSFQLATPSGLALDAGGNLYVADGLLDQTKGRILHIQHGSRKITTILSNLHQPAGLSFQSPDVLCFSEAAAHQVRCVNLQTRAIRVIAGTSKPGLSGDGGAAECAQLNRPMGISFDTPDNLYIADTAINASASCALVPNRRTAIIDASTNTDKSTVLVLEAKCVANHYCTSGHSDAGMCGLD